MSSAIEKGAVGTSADSEVPDMHVESRSLIRDFAVHYRINNYWPPGYKTFFMLNSAKHEIFPVNKSEITNNCKFFLAKHS